MYFLQDLPVFLFVGNLQVSTKSLRIEQELAAAALFPG
jgi:hypothetical protein